ncbi:hypothetical protein [Paraburkholderia phytofirmans]|nr:hypothetical protein [Paraburkholderia phytofirmans]
MNQDIKTKYKSESLPEGLTLRALRVADVLHMARLVDAPRLQTI